MYLKQSTYTCCLKESDIGRLPELFRPPLAFRKVTSMDGLGGPGDTTYMEDAGIALKGGEAGGSRGGEGSRGG